MIGNPEAAQESFLAGLGGGLLDSTLRPLGHMIAHPLDTLAGVGHVIAHPLDSARALGHAVSETASGVMRGDGRSIGTAVGSVGMLFVPGADVAEGAEDVARVGRVGELGEGAADARALGETGSVPALSAGEGSSLVTETAANRAEELANAYRAHGIEEERLESYVSGTDLTQPVTHPVLQPGDSFDMWVRDNGVPGIHGTPPGTDPSTIGIQTLGRHLETYSVNDGATLPITQSTAADFPGGIVPDVGGSGGGLQQILPPNWQQSVTRIDK